MNPKDLLGALEEILGKLVRERCEIMEKEKAARDLIVYIKENSKP